MTEVVRTGQVNLATAWVCLGYPIYYVMCRIQGIRPLTSLILDISLIAPVCLVWIICKEDLSVLNDLMVVMKIIGLGVVSVLALQLNLLANQKLSTSLFGLLSYLEPALLFLLSITVLGQVVAPAMFISFGLIWLGLICLMTNQLRTLKNLRKKPT